MSKTPIKAKVTIVGSGNTGKSSLLLRLTKEKFEYRYIPTVFENKQYNTLYRKRKIEIDFWDTAGQEDYNRIMPLSYPDSTLLVICFAIDQPETFALVQSKWVHQIAFHCREVPFILVGTKSDLRYDSSVIERLVQNGSAPVDREAGEDLAKKIHALEYFECSAKEDENIDAIFNYITEFLYNDYKKKNSCKYLKKVWENVKNIFD